MTALIVPGEATAARLRLTFTVIDQRPPLLGRVALGRFADRFVDDLLALAEAGR